MRIKQEAWECEPTRREAKTDVKAWRSGTYEAEPLGKSAVLALSLAKAHLDLERLVRRPVG